MDCGESRQAETVPCAWTGDSEGAVGRPMLSDMSTTRRDPLTTPSAGDAVK